MARLNKKKVEIIIRRKTKGLSSRLIGRQLEISKRRINQVWREYLKKGSFELKAPGRLPVRILTEREKNLIAQIHEHQRCGARNIARILRFNYKTRIRNDLVHEFLLERGMAVPNVNKQQRRKPWVRYEREHSLSAGHMDWHTARWRENTQVCMVIDDSSRKILSAVECEHATEAETIRLVQQVLNEYGHVRKIREIITDHGTQFFSNTPNKAGELTKNVFQKFLEEQGILHILCRYKHPQSNGKAEKWFHTYERYRPEFESLQAFIQWYNQVRFHESLDLRTPEKVFWERLEPFLFETAGRFFKEVEST